MSWLNQLRFETKQTLSVIGSSQDVATAINMNNGQLPGVGPKSLRIIREGLKEEGFYLKPIETLKFNEFGTKHYQIRIQPNSGCWFIERIDPPSSTNLFTGSEGMEVYRELKRAWRKNNKTFNNLCMEYNYDTH